MSDKEIKLSYEIATDIEYYSDRWNPERLGRVEAKLRLLETILRKERGGKDGYSQEEWDRRTIETTKIIESGKQSLKIWRGKEEWNE